MPSLKYEKPPESLADELLEVEQNAQALSDAISKSNQLPTDFPKEEIVELANQLIGISKGTAEGCRQPLEYSRARLPAIRRTFILTPARSIEIDANEIEPPPLMRGERIDDCLARLTTSVATALEEYRRLASISDTLEETDTSPSIEIDRRDSNIQAAIEKSKSTEFKLSNAISEVDELARPESIAADNLKRQMRDSKRLLGLTRVELSLPSFVPKWFEATVNTLKNYPALVRKTMKSVKIGVDVLQVLANRFSDFQDKVLNAAFDGIKDVADDMIKLSNKWELTAKDAQVEKQINEPPNDFDMGLVYEMLSNGITVPTAWIPWIKELSFYGGLGISGFGSNISNLEALGELHFLESLSLHFVEVYDLLPISNIKELRSLSIFSKYEVDCSPLKKLTKLTNLDLDLQSNSQLKTVAGIENIQRLGLQRRISSNEAIDLSVLKGMQNLQSLEISGFTDEELEKIPKFNNLYALSLSGYKISKLNFVIKLKKLEFLEIYGTNIKDISPAAALEELVELRILYSDIEDISSLSLNKKLERVLVSRGLKVKLSKTIQRKGLVQLF